MGTTVVKFGGSSLASAAQIKKAADIIRSDPSRRYAVVSAPGKRDDSDTKVTDLLYRAFAAAGTPEVESVLAQIEERFRGIIEELGVAFDLEEEMTTLRNHLQNEPQPDYMSSRGEYMNAKIIAAYLDFPFVDAADAVFFTAEGNFDVERTNVKLGEILSGLSCAVIPGFYGSKPDGTVHTFSRGGSDVTGAIVARAVKAELYENWTDVSGMLAADPRIVSQPRPIDCITYKELRELAYMGASVMHEDAVFPVRRAGIPIHIKNTNCPEDHGTRILPSLPAGHKRRRVTGIAGHTGFSSILVEKSLMNREIGFGARLLQILAEHNIPFEHCPTGIDTISVVLASKDFLPQQDEVLEKIRTQLHPDHLAVENNLALIAVVGEGMIYSKGTASLVFQAIAEANVNIRMIDQGSSELNIIIGVREEDYVPALRSIYEKTVVGRQGEDL